MVQPFPDIDEALVQRVGNPYRHSMATFDLSTEFGQHARVPLTLAQIVRRSTMAATGS